MLKEDLETKDGQEEELTGAAKIWDTFLTIFTGIMMVAAAAMMIFTVVSVRTFDRNDRDLFGYKAFIVRSDSMSASGIEAGDLVLMQEVDPAVLVEGDIISFKSLDPDSYGETITHMIRSQSVNEEGRPVFTTYGTTTGVDDAYPVAYEQVQGKYCMTLKKVGSFFTFLKTVPGYICCILLPFLTLIIIQGVASIRLFKEYKEEQMAELEEKRQRELAEMAAEREKLAAEREESQKILEELQRLRAQMEEQEVRKESADQ